MQVHNRDILTIVGLDGCVVELYLGSKQAQIMALWQTYEAVPDCEARPARTILAPRSVRRPRLTPQVDPGPLCRCGESC